MENNKTVTVSSIKYYMGKKISDSMNLPLKEFEGRPIVGRFWI
jgi:hypothetical protein